MSCLLRVISKITKHDEDLRDGDSLNAINQIYVRINIYIAWTTERVHPRVHRTIQGYTIWREVIFWGK